MKLGKKSTGAKIIKRRKKKSYERAGQQRVVKLGEEKKKTMRTRGDNRKTTLLNAKFVNVKKQKLEIKNVTQTPSNRFLARQNILTKGTIIETTDGKKVKITNRPSQEGMINGVFVE